MVWTYLAYLAISIVVTVWVAQTLHKNGRIFLVDSFQGNEPLADSVNHLLVVGFYLINIGAVALALKYGDKAETTQEAIEYLSTKLGLVLVILGGMHLFNVFVFSKMRKRALRIQEPAAAPPADDDSRREFLSRLGAAKRHTLGQ
jgi:cytochrome c biogenesis protein CcdA